MHLIDIAAVAAAPPRLPRQLEGLRRLAYNLYWTWHPEVRVLFNRIDAGGWARYRNPIPVLQDMRDWSRVLDDTDFLVEYETILARFDAYIANGAGHWFQRRHGDELSGPIAYFCAEFGLHESLGIYSGGLGVLAGDHCKAASDMALPFVGVGLLYRHGYFRQAIDADGHQEHAYPDYDPARLPLLRVIDDEGEPILVPVEFPGRTVQATVWLAQVGRVPLLLLDTDIPENELADRPITHQLYVRGREMRLHQEMVLGVGGVRLLRILGIEPAAWHLNEGHSAFMLVERARELTAAGQQQEAALEEVRRDAVFTIHTPVSAGNERFDVGLVRLLATPLVEGSGLDLDRVVELGIGTDGDEGSFDMTAFSLRLTRGANAVSQLHAGTANGTWLGTPRSAILGITNGIHAPTWLGRPMAELFANLGADLDAMSDETPEGRFWERLDAITDGDLWKAHRRQKRELAVFVRGRLLRQFARHGASPVVLESVEHVLDPEVLTIGFARRFATYKRASAGMHLIDIAAVAAAPPRLPRQLEGLRRLAYNLYWTWHPEVRVLFNRIDAGGWARYRNPIPVLQDMRDWSRVLDDTDFLVEYETILARFDAYIANGAGHWFQRRHGDELSGPIAYFCAEFGLHESLGIYSGGLGVLAGDHCKAASDMALPFVGVGLLYRHGYFRQAIDADGHQEHAYPDYDPARLPLLRVIDDEGEPILVPVEFPGRTVQATVWLAQVGRVPLLLLDTDIPENELADRPITHQLYVRGREMRLHQEMVLGVGGVRLLRILGIEPAAWHLNEGHSAFMLVERARELTAAGQQQEAALEEVRRDAVFTIHTPVSAGNERFDVGLVRLLATPLVEGSGLDLDRVVELGIGTDGDEGSFDMTAFSLRLTRGANAVSQLHAGTANGTWLGTPRSAILGITNGIHAPTWLGRPMAELFANLGADLDAMSDETPEGRFWERLDAITDGDLWKAHRRQKRELAVFVRGRLLRQFARHGASPVVLESVEHVLDPEVLTIGFARRFATYKRAALLFSDEDRLARLLWNEERPVQVIFAGKAHPADRPGQRVIRDIFERTQAPRLAGRAFILEDYDMRIARYLVQGVDVWLNNPRRPLEASGTSGMKAAANGIVNVSVLDGWWDEGWTGTNGWAIGGREQSADEEAQDAADAADLYRILEEEVVPRWYERDDKGLPQAWVELMKASIASNIWRFSTTRMLEEYVEQLYLPAAHSSDRATSGLAPSAAIID